MAESSWPTTAGGRAVNDVQWETMVRGLADGVIGTVSDTSVVYGDSTGMQVKVRANKSAWVRGRGWSSGSTEFTKAIASNSSGLTRIDLIVLRLTRSTWAVTTEVRQGTPASTPVPPTLTQDATGSGTGVWEIPLAQVTVGNGVSSISPTNVVNIAWYQEGETVTTLSTSTVQPLAASYTALRHHDTDISYEVVSGAWRRTPWTMPWGVAGGQRYVAGSSVLIVQGGGTTEFASAQTSGPVQLRAYRRYRLKAHVRHYSTAASQVLILRLRETNLAGAIRAEKQLVAPNGSNIFHTEVTGEYTTGASDEVKTFVVSAVCFNGGLWNLYNGDANGNLVGVWIEDVGPAIPNVVPNG